MHNIPDKADLCNTPAFHDANQFLNAVAVIHEQFICLQRRLPDTDRVIDQKKRNIQITKHPAVFVVENLDAQDRGAAVQIER